jgi:hypothetical protein
MSAADEHFLALLSGRRPWNDPETGIIAWAQDLADLHDVSTLPMLLDVIDESLEGPRSWDAVDIALDGICAFARTLAITTLVRLMAHPEQQMRFRAGERLASLGETEDLLKSLTMGRPEPVRIAAAWGLAKYGNMQPLLRYVGTHGPLVVPRIVGSGSVASARSAMPIRRRSATASTASLGCSRVSAST